MASLFGFGKNNNNETTSTTTSGNSGNTVRTGNAEEAGEVHANSVASNANRGGAANTTTTTTTTNNPGGYNRQMNDRTTASSSGNYSGSGDDAMTRSEEQLRVGKESVEAGKARLHKYVTSERVETEVPLTKESVVLQREPITDANRDAAMAGPEIKEAEYEVNLRAERPVATKETVPMERVRLGKQAETTTQTVGDEVRKEHIEYGTTAGVKTNHAGTGMGATGTQYNNPNNNNAVRGA